VASNADINRALRAAAGRVDVAEQKSGEADESQRERRIRELEATRREYGSLFEWERRQLVALRMPEGGADAGAGGMRFHPRSDMNAAIRRAAGRPWYEDE
jgi:hypothetical protein